MTRIVQITACAAALACGAWLRLWASTLGWNYDVDSWWLVAHLVEAGENVYVNTYRMPYGPLSPAILWLALQLEHALGFDGIMPFHVIVAGLLTLADMGIAVTLARAYGYGPAIVFALCPVSILITGYHSQIDNLAILFGLWSWRSAERQPEGGRLRDIVVAALLLGVSLAIKHVFLFFPLWVAAMPPRPVAQRVMYGTIAYAVVVAAFVPFVSTPAGWTAVHDHVFAYRGADWFANALIARLTPDGEWAIRAFMAGMVAAGVIVGRAAPRAAFLVYLVLLVALSPTLANQYLAIPLIACAVHWRNPFAWAYVGVATLALLASPDNVGALPAMQPIAARLGALGFALAAGASSALWPQLCLFVFLASWPIGWFAAPRAGRRRRQIRLDPRG